MKNKHKCKIWRARAGYWNVICYNKKCVPIKPWYTHWDFALLFVIAHQETRGVK